MTIIEAIKSGRPFRRKGDGSWYCDHDRSDCAMFRVPDILADDWEIQEPAVTITRSQFNEAVRSIPCHEIHGRTGPEWIVNTAELARKLGLEE